MQLGAGVIEARDAALDVARLGRVALGLYVQISDDVDALAGRDVLEGYPAGRTAWTSPTAGPYSRATVPPARPRKMSASAARCSSLASWST